MVHPAGEGEDHTCVTCGRRAGEVAAPTQGQAFFYLVQPAGVELYLLLVVAQRLSTIHACVDRVGSGESVIDPVVVRQLFSRVRSPLSRLTPREREVLDLALKGNSSKGIAHELGISHRTVELHRSNLLEKLGVASVSELLRLKLDSGT